MLERLLPARLGVGFRWLVASSWSADLGDGFAVAAGPLLVASRTHNASLVALALLLQRLPWLLFVAGIVIGMAAGTLLPIAGAGLLSDLLPVPPIQGIYLTPLVTAAAYGFLTAIAFSLLALGRAASIPGAALFRDALLPERVRPSLALIAVIALAAGLLVAMTVLTAPDRSFALWFCAAAVGTLALFRLGDALLMLAARRAPRLPAPWAKLGLANLYRPGAATPLMLVSVGLGLSTLAAVALIQGNIRAQIMDQLPTNAPSFFFIDLQNDQLARFDQVARAQPGADDIEEVPSLRARRRRGERRAGGPGEGNARDPLRPQRRPRPDLCRHAAQRLRASSLGSGGHPNTMGRRWCPSMPVWPPAGACMSATRSG